MKQIILLLLLLPCCLQAQTLNSEFPVITQEDLLKTVYEKDPTAEAVVLFDQGIITIDGNFGTSLKRFVRIKIFRKDGYRKGDVVFYTRPGSLNQVSAVTHRFDPEAKKITSIPMLDNAILRTKWNKWNDKVAFSLPNVSEGVIIEYTYTVKMPYVIPYWYFQHDIPVEFSECMLNGSKNYKEQMTGSLPEPAYTQNYKSVYQRWVMRNVPAFKKEPLMPDEEVYFGAMHFYSPSRTWSDVVTDLHTEEYFWPVVTNYYTKKITNSVIQGLTKEEDKIKAICNYVKQEVAWNGVYDHRGNMPKDVLEAKTGTSGDINLLLGSMLDKAGINFAMVVTSTRSNGFVDKRIPYENEFDHVLCMVMSEDTLLLDATDRSLPYNVVPAECLNYDGLLITEKNFGWINFSPTQKVKVTAQANVVLNPEGTLTGLLTLTHEGYAAQKARKTMAKLGETQFVKDFGADHQLDISETTIQDESVEKPFLQKHQVSFHGKAEVQGDRIYLNPFLFFQEAENVFKDEKRLYPVDFGIAEDKTFIGEITIPPGYVVDEIPASKMLNLPGNTARYLLNCENRQSKIIITSKLERKKLIYTPSEYLALREFFNRVVAKNMEQVVLKKAE